MKASLVLILPRSFALVALSLLILRTTASASVAPFQANGIKIGEVTDTSAIVWVRLTLQRTRGFDVPLSNVGGRKKRKEALKRLKDKDQVEEQDVEEWLSWSEALEESAPGTSGYARIQYRETNMDGTGGSFKSTSWEFIGSGLNDYTHQFTLEVLTPNTRYEVLVESRSKAGLSGETVRGWFKTAPLPNESERVVFTVSSCMPKKPDREEGYNIYPQMLKLDPDFFVHTGDIVYYDRLATTVDIARHHWHWAYTWPTNIDFHRRVSSYFMKDDHDTWQDDCYPAMKSQEMEYFTFAQGQKLFLEQVPMGPTTYRTFRWGKHLQIWLVEGRDFRSPNDAPDGPDKTIWGKEQLQWFTRTVRKSDATFRVLISPTPIVGPDRKSHKDNHANRSFKHEGAFIRRFLSTQKNMIVICGDRHWQYMSVHPRTGVQEYSVGPHTDEHTGNLGQTVVVQPEHNYVNVTTGGFLSAIVDTVNATPRLAIKFHGVMGNINYEDMLIAAEEEELIEEAPAIERKDVRRRRSPPPEAKREDLFSREQRNEG